MTLWFVKGSGGESQFRTFSCNWSPARSSQPLKTTKGDTRNYERLPLFTRFAISCIETFTAQSAGHEIESRRQNIPRACRIPAVVASSSIRGQFSGLSRITNQHSKAGILSMTDFILLARPWTICRACVTVIRASSSVRRSNLWRAASISPPVLNNTLANFSEEF